jgi:hypothetical protein
MNERREVKKAEKITSGQAPGKRMVLAGFQHGPPEIITSFLTQ